MGIMAGQYSADDVAVFMGLELKRLGELHQEEIAWTIQQRFGKEFVYQNKNLNLAIAKPVLDAFRERTPDVVWEKGGRYWRYRQPWDSKKRAQE